MTTRQNTPLGVLASLAILAAAADAPIRRIATEPIGSAPKPSPPEPEPPAAPKRVRKKHRKRATLERRRRKRARRG